MKTFEIAIIDNDYNALVTRLIVNAPTRSVADRYCHNNTWTGHTYMITNEYTWVSESPDHELQETHEQP